MVVIGLVTVTFSGYMLSASVWHSRKIVELATQTRILRETIQRDRDWQKRHQVFIVQIERAVRDAVLRKEALIRAALKVQYGWDDAKIDKAIHDELNRMIDSGTSTSTMPPVLPPDDTPPVDFSESAG